MRGNERTRKEREKDTSKSYWEFCQKYFNDCKKQKREKEIGK